jgi:hypothetical protein
MTRKRTSKRKANGAYNPGTHTVPLPELFFKLRAGGLVNSIARHQDAKEWNGNLTYTAAVDAAELGKWDAPTIEHVTLPEVTGVSEDVRFFHDVTGQHLDISAFICGEPEHWQVEEPIEKPCGRIIRLAVEIGGNAFVTAASMANRGQAIIALIHSLELQGHSVEVTIVRAYRNGKKENYNFLIPVKQAGQAVDMRRLQFMIGHPAFYRRCLFALSEIAHGESLETCSTTTLSHAPEGYIHLPSSQGLCDTPEQSLLWANSFAHSLINSQLQEN